MRTFTSGRVRRRLGIGAGVALTASLLMATMPGTASAQTDEDQPLFPKGQAYMGSTITANEGPGSAPDGPPPTMLATVEGVDVSGHQGNVNWQSLWDSGVRFAYVKATEGNYYKNEYFTQQYNGSYDIGMIRGSYHFATPNDTSGAVQANYFVSNGGGWSKDGKTLPGVLDIEHNPYGATCYGLSQAGMVNWIKDFTSTYKEKTGRDAVIYTTTSWWTECTGNSSAFGDTNPLWIARWADSPGSLPAGWGFHTFWQYTETGPIVGDHDVFNGDMDRLKALANG